MSGGRVKVPQAILRSLTAGEERSRVCVVPEPQRRFLEVLTFEQ